MVKPGGRLAIILPQGIFNNTSESDIRKYILRRARILAVLGLDGNTFKPHTGTKTSILFLRKWESPQVPHEEFTQDYPIFFCVSKVPFKDNSGRYIYLPHSNGIHQTDLNDIADAFVEWGKQRLSEGDTHFEFLGGL